MIRTRRDADVPGIAALVREAVPGWTSSEAGIRHRQATAPARARRTDWVAEPDGDVAGISSAELETDGERDDVARVRVLARPARRRRGIGTALYAPAERHALAVGARRLPTGATDDPASRAFAERRGFRHALGRRRANLDPRIVDAAELAALGPEKAEHGFALAPHSAVNRRLGHRPSGAWLSYAGDVE